MNCESSFRFTLSADYFPSFVSRHFKYKKRPMRASPTVNKTPIIKLLYCMTPDTNVVLMSRNSGLKVLDKTPHRKMDTKSRTNPIQRDLFTFTSSNLTAIRNISGNETFWPCRQKEDFLISMKFEASLFKFFRCRRRVE